MSLGGVFVRLFIGRSVPLSLVLLIATVSVVKSDTLIGGVLTNWNPNQLYTASSYLAGFPYWNNQSGDGNQANIGWCLIGSSQCGSQALPGYTPPGYMPFYDSGLAAPSDMYFAGSGSNITLTLQFALTDQKGGSNGTDVFGYYITDSTGTSILSTGVAFTSSQAIGSKFTLPSIPKGEYYGFFIENIQGLDTPNQTDYVYYMDEADNTANGSMPADGLQHFAVFSNGSTYYVGADDADACQGSFVPGSSPCVPASQFDYNDIVVSIATTANAPEPAPLALIGFSLVGAIPFLRRRFAR